MGRFKKERFKSKEGQLFDIFSPTVFKKGSINIKGKEKTFVRRVKKRRKN